ncbi:hypothetical protein HDU88_002813 [Geranomyces variabilis]|nr:hypothetical protein HDU88_002813 [Geranomyces variabilis]
MPAEEPSHLTDSERTANTVTITMAPALTTAEPVSVLKRPAQAEPVPPYKDELRSSSPSSQNGGGTGTTSPAPSASEAGTAPEDGEKGLDEMLLTAVQSTKDRLFVLKLDNQCENFLKDESQTRLAFPHMNSYQRLIIHRIAVHFGLIHVADPARKGVVLFKSPESAIPTLRLYDIPLSEVASDQTPVQSIKIMQRHHHHGGRGSRHSSTDSGSEGGAGGPKTIEEREAAYQAARARIFQEDAESDVSSTSGQSSGSRGTNRQSKATPRSQVARPRNPQGPPRQRAQQSTMYMAPGYPTGDYVEGFQYYPHMDPSTIRGGHMAPMHMGSSGPRPQYPPTYEGAFAPPNQYFMPPPAPQPGAFPHPQSGPPAQPYCDWNGVSYPAQFGNAPPQPPRDHDGSSSYGYPPNLAAYAGASSSYGLNPQALAFTSQYSSVRSDGVALHYYPNPSNSNSTPRSNNAQRPNMGPFWADPSARADHGARSDGAADAPFPYQPTGNAAGGRGRHYQGREPDATRNVGYLGASQHAPGSQGPSQDARVYWPPDGRTPFNQNESEGRRRPISSSGEPPKGSFGDVQPQSLHRAGFPERPAAQHGPGSAERSSTQAAGTDDQLALSNSLAALRLSHGDGNAEPMQRS